MKKKLQLRKERLRSLSNRELATIASGLPVGNNGFDLECDMLLIAAVSDSCNVY